MKVIDLLMDKVNGKKLPNKIKANSIVFILDKDNNEYKREDGDAEEFYTEYMIDGFVDLTDEVEVIEDKKKIEQFTDGEMKVYHDMSAPIDDLAYKVILIIDKINEIIDKLEEK